MNRVERTGTFGRLDKLSDLNGLMSMGLERHFLHGILDFSEGTALSFPVGVTDVMTKITFTCAHFP